MAPLGTDALANENCTQIFLKEEEKKKKTEFSLINERPVIKKEK